MIKIRKDKDRNKMADDSEILNSGHARVVQEPGVFDEIKLGRKILWTR